MHRPRSKSGIVPPVRPRDLAVWAACAAGMLALLVGLKLAGAQPSDLTRDVGDVYPAIGPEIGLIGRLGQFVLAGAVAICAITAAILRRASPRQARMLGGTALLLAVVLVDDGATLHEDVLPGAGVPEAVVYALYAGAGAAWLAAFRGALVAPGGWLLVLGGASLVLSAALDAVGGVPITLEDFPKLVGIGSICAYAVDHATRALRPILDE